MIGSSGLACRTGVIVLRFAGKCEGECEARGKCRACVQPVAHDSHSVLASHASARLKVQKNCTCSAGYKWLECCTSMAEVMGLNSLKAGIFIQALFSQLLSCVHAYDNLLFVSYFLWKMRKEINTCYPFVDGLNPGWGGGYSMDVWAGRCGRSTQTLTLFKTEIFDFPTLFKTASRFLRPRLNTFDQKSLPSFVVAQASCISANKKGTNSAFCTIFTNLKSTLFPIRCKDTLFKTKCDEIDAPLKTKKA